MSDATPAPDTTEAPKRAYAYKWVGGMRPDGLPHMHLGNHDLPAENLDPAFTANLSDTQVAAIARYPELYEPQTKRAWEGLADDADQPKWYATLVEKAAAEGAPAPAPRLEGETQKAYTERTADMTPGTPEPADPATIDPGLRTAEQNEQIASQEAGA